MYSIKPTTKFKKDIKRAKQRGYDLSLLSDVVKKLANGETLDKKYHDHPLRGDLDGCRECHIAFDWVLVYEIDNGNLILYLVRTGMHSETFS